MVACERFVKRTGRWRRQTIGSSQSGADHAARVTDVEPRRTTRSMLRLLTRLDAPRARIERELRFVGPLGALRSTVRAVGGTPHGGATHPRHNRAWSCCSADRATAREVA